MLFSLNHTWKRTPLITLKVNNSCRTYNFTIKDKVRNLVMAYYVKCTNTSLSHLNVLKHCCIHIMQGFQYFSSVPVLHYIQAVLFIKIWTFSLIPYATIFEIKRYRLPFWMGKITWFRPLLKGLDYWKICVIFNELCMKGNPFDHPKDKLLLWNI